MCQTLLMAVFTLVKCNVCQSVHNCSIVGFKSRNEIKLRSNTSLQTFKQLAFETVTRAKTMLLCWMLPTFHSMKKRTCFKSILHITQALSLNVRTIK